MFVLILNVEAVPFCNTQILMSLSQQVLLKNVVVLSGKCSNCKTHYFADHENYPQVEGPRRQVYLNNAKYLKLGKCLYVNRSFSNAVVNGSYSFHASVSAYAIILDQQLWKTRVTQN
jgi:hypothetical protein